MKRVYLISVLSLVAACASAQGFYIKGSTVSVSPQTVLSIPDSLVNTGTLINNGEITVSGAWFNQGTYVAGTGGINFDSDLTQVINHNDQSIANLVISGGGVKQFLGDVTVQSTLDLQNGILESGNGAKIIMDKTVTITGGSDASHINGPVQRSGTGDWIFPVGNGTKYLPVAINGVTDATATGTITLHELTPGQNLTGLEELVKLSNKRYWELVLGSGQLGNAMINLPMVAEDGLTSDLNLLVVAGSDDATTLYKSLGVSGFTGTLSSGTVASQTVSTRYYTVAAISGDNSIEVFNAVSPNGDGKNDFMKIQNIEKYPNNHVFIYSRWGDRVFDVVGYDNTQKYFKGESQGSKLPDGTYFYTIDLGDGSKPQTGFLEIR